MAGVSALDLLDDSSSWHSAFDPPRADPDEPVTVGVRRKRKRPRVPRAFLDSSSGEIERRRKKKQKRRAKKAKKLRKKRSVRRDEAASSEESRKEVLPDPTMSEQVSTEVLDEGADIFDFLYTSRQESGSSRPSKSTACAKVLVRSGLRCPCHFLLVSQCPNGCTVRRHAACWCCKSCAFGFAEAAAGSDWLHTWIFMSLQRACG